MALTLASASLYTLNIALAFSCVRQLLVQKESFRSKRRLTISCVYVVALVAVASGASIHLNIATINTVKGLLLASGRCVNDFPIYPMSLPIAIWGADGILVRLAPTI